MKNGCRIILRKDIEGLDDLLVSLGSASLEIDYLFSRGAQRAMEKKALNYGSKQGADIIVFGPGGYQIGGSFAFPFGGLGSFSQTEIEMYKLKD